MEHTGSFWKEDSDVDAGTSAIVTMAHGGRVSIGVSCLAGGTAVVAFTLQDPADADAIWIQLGTVADGQTGGFSRLEPTRALRVTAAGAGCSMQVLQGSC